MSQPIDRLEALRTLRAANLDVAFATAFGTLVTGSFQTGFVQHLGGSDAWINLFVALPSLLGILQIPGAIWGRSFTSYKRYILPGGLLWRLFYVPLIALPLLAIPNEGRLILLAVCIAIASAVVLMVNPIYNDWLAEMVPPSSRGWYFGRRQVIGAIAGAIAGFIGGVILDAFRHAGHAEQGFATVFGIGCVCAGVSFVGFMLMRDIPRENPIRQPVLQSIKGLSKPWKDVNYRKVLIFLGAFTVGQAFAGNLFTAFALESLKMSFTLLQIAAAAHALGMVIFTPIWGYLADKYGNRPMLFLFILGVTLTPGMWLFCYPGRDVMNAAILIPGHVFSGAMWGGALLCQLNLMLATADEKDRASYLGLGMAMMAVVGGIAPLFGGELMSYLRATASAEYAYKAIFLLTMGFRVLSAGTLLPVGERGSVRIREALRHLRKVTPKGFAALRNLRGSESPRRREEAIKSAAKEEMLVAGEEIIDALHDPSPGVRRQAAIALARLGDARAVEALLHQLKDHPDLVEEETIEALGVLGDGALLEPLLGYLRSPRANLRRAAAKSLGRIGSSGAIGPLLDAASDMSDPDLRRSALQALRTLSAKESGPIAAAAVLDPHPSVRIAAAELIAELEFKNVADDVRDSLQRYSDEAESEVAYALGAIGTLDDLSTILRHAQQCVSIITRRRCLLGVARMLGVEGEAYRLLMSEGFARDAELLDLARPLMRKSKRIKSAVERYSAGFEENALEILAKGQKGEVLDAFAQNPVKEAFLVAILSVSKQAL